MSKTRRKSILVALFTLPFIMAAMSLHYLVRSGTLPQSAMLLRSVIYISLLLAWGVSLRTRIIQAQVQRFLLAIVALMVLWMLLRTVKHAVGGIDLKRWLWYFYYLPMLFIPLIALFVSMSLGKPEDYRLPRGLRLLYLPTALLLLAVLTNDLHQRVFSFPSGVMSDLDYRYAFGYYVILGWVSLCALASFSIMLTKCRIPHSRTVLFLPLLPLGLSFAYTILYIRRVRWLLLVAGDMTTAQCMMIFGIFEGCLQCGLIQSNMGYDELFEATTLPVQITDDSLRTRYTSAAGAPLPEETLRRIEADSVRLDGDTLLKRHRLRRGYVFWQEDISELNRVSEALELTREELRDTGDVLAAEREQQSRLLRLKEENRLFDSMEEQTARQVALLRRRIAALRETEDMAEVRRLLGQIIVLGTYVKRRNNLIFVATQYGEIPVQELRLCLNESGENLNICGIECKTAIHLTGTLPAWQATAVYDLFEAVVERGLDTLASLLLSAETVPGAVEVNICLSGEVAADGLAREFPYLQTERDEDGLRYFSLRLENTAGR